MFSSLFFSHHHWLVCCAVTNMQTTRGDKQRKAEQLVLEEWFDSKMQFVSCESCKAEALGHHSAVDTCTPRSLLMLFLSEEYSDQHHLSVSGRVFVYGRWTGGSLCIDNQDNRKMLHMMLHVWKWQAPAIYEEYSGCVDSAWAGIAKAAQEHNSDSFTLLLADVTVIWCLRDMHLVSSYKNKSRNQMTVLVAMLIFQLDKHNHRFFKIAHGLKQKKNLGRLNHVQFRYMAHQDHWKCADIGRNFAPEQNSYHICISSCLGTHCLINVTFTFLMILTVLLATSRIPCTIVQ